VESNQHVLDTECYGEHDEQPPNPIGRKFHQKNTKKLLDVDLEIDVLIVKFVSIRLVD
jgi:hypothetical protein